MIHLLVLCINKERICVKEFEDRDFCQRRTIFVRRVKNRGFCYVAKIVLDINKERGVRPINTNSKVKARRLWGGDIELLGVFFRVISLTRNLWCQNSKLCIAKLPSGGKQMGGKRRRGGGM